MCHREVKRDEKKFEQQMLKEIKWDKGIQSGI